MRLLLLEDDLHLGKALTKALAQEGFAPQWLRRVQDARALLEQEGFAIALVDIGLPDGSGLELLRSIRARGDPLPILLLTARDAIDERVAGLDAGADDYLTKPFAVPELVSRIRALVRRSAGFTTQTWCIGPIAVNPARHEVRRNGELVELSPREYRLLLELARWQGQVVPKRVLMRAAFDATDEVESNALEVHIHHLRRKIGERFIRTVRGVGYIITGET